MVPWRTVFGNDQPVEVEIGPGRGDVLLTFAAARPTVNFFAIERARRGVEAILARAARRGLVNIRVIAGDARCIIERLVPSYLQISLDTLTIFDLAWSADSKTLAVSFGGGPVWLFAADGTPLISLSAEW